uniref:Secreted protein n=1 Tax=Oryza rufipogon TaxID=4529 RepID=A0A0E0Q667_ORYRU
MAAAVCCLILPALAPSARTSAPHCPLPDANHRAAVKPRRLYIRTTRLKYWRSSTKKPSARLRMQRWEVEVGGRARWQMKAASEETRPDEVGDVRDEERHDEEEDLVVERTAIVLVCPGIAPLPLQLFTRNHGYCRAFGRISFSSRLCL